MSCDRKVLASRLGFDLEQIGEIKNGWINFALVDNRPGKRGRRRPFAWNGERFSNGHDYKNLRCARLERLARELLQEAGAVQP